MVGMFYQTAPGIQHPVWSTVCLQVLIHLCRPSKATGSARRPHSHSKQVLQVGRKQKRKRPSETVPPTHVSTDLARSSHPYTLSATKLHTPAYFCKATVTIALYSFPPPHIGTKHIATTLSADSGRPSCQWGGQRRGGLAPCTRPPQPLAPLVRLTNGKDALKSASSCKRSTLVQLQAREATAGNCILPNYLGSGKKSVSTRERWHVAGIEPASDHSLQPKVTHKHSTCATDRPPRHNRRTSPQRPRLRN